MLSCFSELLTYIDQFLCLGQRQALVPALGIFRGAEIPMSLHLISCLMRAPVRSLEPVRSVRALYTVVQRESARNLKFSSVN